MTWTYNGQEFTEEMIGESYGYVYIIVNKRTIGSISVKNSLARLDTKQSKAKEKRSERLPIGSHITDQTKNYRKMLRLSVQRILTEKFFSYAQHDPNAHTEKRWRYSIVAHY